MASLVVEFFGIPRERAGQTELTVASGTLAEVLAAVAQQCPRLKDVRRSDGSLNGHYRLSLDGQRFLTDVNEILPAGSRVLLLSADVGG